MTHSLWQQTSTLGRSRSHSEVVIVGAGIAGVSAALELDRRGVECVVIDRLGPATGASGKNAGLIMRGAADNYAASVRRWGRPAAKLFWEVTEQTRIGLFERGLEKVATLRQLPSALLATTESERVELIESTALLKEDGFEVEWLDRPNDSLALLPEPVGCLINPRDAICNPVDVVGLLTSQLRRPVIEGQTVTQLIPEDNQVRVVINNGEIVAKRVIVALNAYTPQLLPSLSEFIEPNRGQMLAVDAPDLRLEYGYYANHGSEYFRPVGNDGVIALGGCRRRAVTQEQTTVDATSEPVQAALEAYAESVFGHRHPIVARWAGVMAFTPDGLPITSTACFPGHSRPDGRLWVCAGFNGHGMALAYRLAQNVVASMLEEDEPKYPLSRFDSNPPNAS